MSMSPTLRRFMSDRAVAYDLLQHHHTETSLDAAHAAHIPEDNLAKSVILEDETGYVMAVIPANRHLKIRELNHKIKRSLGLATEMELLHLFKDCAIGAIPAIGQAYGLETVVDESLMMCSDVYFEAGDHEKLVHVKGPSFRKLFYDSTHANICVH